MRLVRKLLPYTSVAMILALGYAGWVLLSRSRRDRATEQALESARAQANEKIVKAYGDGHLKILAFYANPPALKRGDKGLLCYGVANAKSVRIDPPVEASPSLSRCVEIAPKGSTEYRFTAENPSEPAESRTVIVKVR